MKAQKPKVLLIRKSQTGKGYSPLSTRLTARGCDCRIAVSNQEVDALLDKHNFDLVLGPIRLDGDSLYRLIDRLAGSNTTLFYALGVEEGCWWLPALRRGENCFEAPAIHHKAFVTALEDAIEEIGSTTRIAARRRLKHPTAKVPVPPGSASHNSLIALSSADLLASPSAGDLLLPPSPARAKRIAISARRTAR